MEDMGVAVMTKAVMAAAKGAMVVEDTAVEGTAATVAKEAMAAAMGAMVVEDMGVAVMTKAVMAAAKGAMVVEDTVTATANTEVTTEAVMDSMYTHSRHIRRDPLGSSNTDYSFLMTAVNMRAAVTVALVVLLQVDLLAVLLATKLTTTDSSEPLAVPSSEVLLKTLPRSTRTRKTMATAVVVAAAATAATKPYELAIPDTHILPVPLF